MPRDVSLSDSKCLNGGHEWVKKQSVSAVPGLDVAVTSVGASSSDVDCVVEPPRELGGGGSNMEQPPVVVRTGPFGHPQVAFFLHSETFF